MFHVKQWKSAQFPAPFLAAFHLGHGNGVELNGSRGILRMFSIGGYGSAKAFAARNENSTRFFINEEAGCRAVPATFQANYSPRCCFDHRECATNRLLRAAMGSAVSGGDGKQRECAEGCDSARLSVKRVSNTVYLCNFH